MQYTINCAITSKKKLNRIESIFKSIGLEYEIKKENLYYIIYSVFESYNKAKSMLRKMADKILEEKDFEDIDLELKDDMIIYDEGFTAFIIISKYSNNEFIYFTDTE